MSVSGGHSNKEKNKFNRLEAGECLTCLRHRKTNVTEQSEQGREQDKLQKGATCLDALGSCKGFGFYCEKYMLTEEEHDHTYFGERAV